MTATVTASQVAPSLGHVLPLTWGKVTAKPFVPLLLIKTLDEILSWSKCSLLLALTHWFLKAYRSSHNSVIKTQLGSHFCCQINKYHCIPFSSANATLEIACVLTKPCFPLFQKAINEALKVPIHHGDIRSVDRDFYDIRAIDYMTLLCVARYAEIALLSIYYILTSWNNL